MGRKKRRQAERSEEKRRKQREKESPRIPLVRRIVSIALDKIWGLVVVVATLIGLYVVFRPHISVEPLIALNPVDPYTTQFKVKNENPMFGVYKVNAVCWPRNMQSGNNFSVVSLAPLPNVHHEIPQMEAGGAAQWTALP
jgi:hypothetical protein